ncbi:MAG: protein kinase [bacterium]|nr:protein kinase [bacterium]
MKAGKLTVNRQVEPEYKSLQIMDGDVAFDFNQVIFNPQDSSSRIYAFLNNKTNGFRVIKFIKIASEQNYYKAVSEIMVGRALLFYKDIYKSLKSPLGLENISGLDFMGKVNADNNLLGQFALKLEYVQGYNLRAKLTVMPKSFNNQEVYKLNQHVINGMHFLSELGVIHSDIKPENVMWEYFTDTYKLVDLGDCKIVESKVLNELSGSELYEENIPVNNISGTEGWLSPEEQILLDKARCKDVSLYPEEVLKNSEHRSKSDLLKADLFSLSLLNLYVRYTYNLSQKEQMIDPLTAQSKYKGFLDKGSSTQTRLDVFVYGNLDIDSKKRSDFGKYCKLINQDTLKQALTAKGLITQDFFIQVKAIMFKNIPQ